jgi:phosphoadenosine phosphosulfate reductase
MSSTLAVSSTSDFRLGFPDGVDAEAANTVRRVIKAAPETDGVYALVSGGHDSLTAMHVVYQSHQLDLDGIIHINTGIGIPETTAFVKERAKALDLTYYEVGAPCDEPSQEHEYRRPHEEYTALIQRFGFPGPGAHKYMYWNLKEKPLSRFLKTLEDDLLLISGVSRHESQNRMENVDASGQQDYLGYPTISPLVEFTPLDVRRYRRGFDLPMSPVKERLEISGECLCLAPDTLVASENGWRCIQDLSVGDRVYSLQDGEMRLTDVVETHVQSATEMVRIKPYYRPAVTATPNHPFYARMTGYERTSTRGYEKYVHDPLWVDASEIAKVVRANRGATRNVDQNFRLAVLFRTKETPVDLTDDELRFLGYFVAEGAYQWRPSRDSRTHGVVFCLARESRPLAENIQDAFERCFPDLMMRIEEKEDPRDNREYLFLRTGYPKVSDFVEEWVDGVTSRKLTLDPRLLTANVDQQQTLLDAMWQGDGSDYIVERAGRANEQVSAYGTSSKRLALQVQEMLLRQGEVYGVNQSGNDSYLVRQNRGDVKSASIEGNTLWTRVQEVEAIGEREKYNITVRDEPNYLTEAGLVHNCGSFSKRNEFRMIRLFYPDVYRRILCLEATVGAFAAIDDGPDEAYDRWGHNRLKDHEREAMDDPDQMLLCQSCEQRHQCNAS